MESFDSEGWGDTCGRVLGVVVGEFCKGEQLLPVVLLVVDEDSKVLLEDNDQNGIVAIQQRPTMKTMEIESQRCMATGRN